MISYDIVARYLTPLSYEIDYDVMSDLKPNMISQEYIYVCMISIKYWFSLSYDIAQAIFFVGYHRILFDIIDNIIPMISYFDIIVAHGSRWPWLSSPPAVTLPDSFKV